LLNGIIFFVEFRVGYKGGASFFDVLKRIIFILMVLETGAENYLPKSVYSLLFAERTVRELLIFLFLFVAL
jgi:hypothetical protein